MIYETDKTESEKIVIPYCEDAPKGDDGLPTTDCYCTLQTEDPLEEYLRDNGMLTDSYVNAANTFDTSDANGNGIPDICEDLDNNNDGGDNDGGGTTPIELSNFTSPVDMDLATVTQGFSGCSAHNGIDIGSWGYINIEIYASAPGTVIFKGWSTVGYGNLIKIDHGNGIVALYAHLLESRVNVGDTVQQGQIIGLMGSTGNSSGVHLHFELRRNDVYTDCIDPTGIEKRQPPGVNGISTTQIMSPVTTTPVTTKVLSSSTNSSLKEFCSKYLTDNVPQLCKDFFNGKTDGNACYEDTGTDPPIDLPDSDRYCPIKAQYITGTTNCYQGPFGDFTHRCAGYNYINLPLDLYSSPYGSNFSNPNFNQIIAPESGTLYDYRPDHSGGDFIKIKTDNNIIYEIGHLDNVTKTSGRINAGETIGIFSSDFNKYDASGKLIYNYHIHVFAQYEDPNTGTKYNLSPYYIYGNYLGCENLNPPSVGETNGSQVGFGSKCATSGGRLQDVYVDYNQSANTFVPNICGFNAITMSNAAIANIIAGNSNITNGQGDAGSGECDQTVAQYCEQFKDEYNKEDDDDTDIPEDDDLKTCPIDPNYQDVNISNPTSYTELIQKVVGFVNAYNDKPRIPWWIIAGALQQETSFSCGRNYNPSTGEKSPVEECTGDPNQKANAYANGSEAVGVAQFTPNAFKVIVSNTYWWRADNTDNLTELMNACMDYIGVNRSINQEEPNQFPNSRTFYGSDLSLKAQFSRNRVGDSLCAATIMYSENAAGGDYYDTATGRFINTTDYVPPEEWSEQTVWRAGAHYYGDNLFWQCSDNYCSLILHHALTKHYTAYDKSCMTGDI